MKRKAKIRGTKPCGRCRGSCKAARWMASTVVQAPSASLEGLSGARVRRGSRGRVSSQASSARSMALMAQQSRWQYLGPVPDVPSNHGSQDRDSEGARTQMTDQNWKPRVISTFSGCGGSSLGYRLAGCDVRLAVEWEENAVLTYRQNFPTTEVFHGDIAQLSVERARELARLSPGEELDIFDGSPPCFPAGTPVETARGWVPIEDVIVGDLAVTHAGRLRRVARVGSKRWSGDAVLVSTKYSWRSTTSTPEHPYLVRRGDATEWTEANQLRVGDLVLRPRISSVAPSFDAVRLRTSKSERVYERAPRVDLERIAWLLGFFVAEGHLRGHGDGRRGVTRRTVVYSIAAHEVEATCARLVAAGYNPTASRPDRGAAKVSVSDVDLWSVCSSFGHGAGNKRVPPWVHGMPREWVAEFLAGYFAGDGCVRRNGRTNGTAVKATTVSEQLAYGVAGLVSVAHGVVASVEKLYDGGKRTIEGRAVTVRDAFSVSYRPLMRVARPGKVDDDGCWVPVRGVELVPFEGRVYNLEVEDDNSYVAGGVAVHNCQGFSTAAGSRNPEDERNQLFLEYARLLRGLRPRAFIMENVRGMIIGEMRAIFDEVMRTLRGCGYRVRARLLNAKWYGVAQSRERVFIVGIREDLGVEPTHPEPTVARPVTVREALAGVVINDKPTPLSPRYRQIWHRLRPGRSIKDDVMLKIGSDSYFGAAKVNPDKPCMTICKTVRMDGFGGIYHWEEPRVLATEECQRLASFPDDFVFLGDFVDRWARIGNCVPPFLMRAVAANLRGQLAGLVAT